jgi:hypothetical protein
MGRDNGMAPLCLGESVTATGRDGLTEVCADGKPMQIFGCNEIDREMIRLKKNSEELTEIKLVSVRENIRFRRFSTTNKINSCDFDRDRIRGEKRRTMCCSGTKKKKQLVGDCLS